MTGFVEVTCSQTFITVIRFEVWWKTLGFQENVKPERSLDTDSSTPTYFTQLLLQPRAQHGPTMHGPVQIIIIINHKTEHHAEKLNVNSAIYPTKLMSFSFAVSRICTEKIRNEKRARKVY